MRVSALNRFVSVALIVPFVMATAPSASGATAAPGSSGQAEAGSAQGKDTMAAGTIDGEAMAGRIGTKGKIGLGLGVGLVTGLIGTGIGYAVIGPEPMTPQALQRYSSKGSDYQLGFKTAWDKKTKSKKRRSFLVGGLLGTAAFVAIITVESTKY
jgi:hypothetical protein